MLCCNSYRHAAGVLENNTYVFPSTNSLTHCSGWHDYNYVCQKSSITNINARKMRHFTATAMDQVSMTSREKDTMLAQFGHSSKIHESIFKCSASSRSILVSQKIAGVISRINTATQSTENSNVPHSIANSIVADDEENSTVPDATHNDIFGEQLEDATVAPKLYRACTKRKLMIDVC